MSLVRRTMWPFRVMDPFFDDFFDWDTPDFTLLRVPRMQMPRLDIKEEDGKYLLSAEVPGFSKDDINIEIKDNILTISSDHDEEKSEEKEGYIYKERSTRSFCRSLQIPEGITPEEISAKLEEGILHITIPKKEPEPPKKVEIKENKELKDVEVKGTES
ncbi:MAG: Hsp20/alpha crystallin family protein [Promethearchaeota archaeon]|nr:MAG: Hsp20/alpha crystallin family protein [Candidatus Lokiarchaeota archaeon]